MPERKTGWRSNWNAILFSFRQESALRFFPPVCGFLAVLRNARALFQAGSQLQLGIAVSLLSGFAIPKCRLAPALPEPAESLGKIETHVILGGVISLLGGLLEPGDGLLEILDGAVALIQTPAVEVLSGGMSVFGGLPEPGTGLLGIFRMSCPL